VGIKVGGLRVHNPKLFDVQAIRMTAQVGQLTLKLFVATDEDLKRLGNGWSVNGICLSLICPRSISAAIQQPLVQFVVLATCGNIRMAQNRGYKF
jgi:hypothetical protein